LKKKINQKQNRTKKMKLIQEFINEVGFNMALLIGGAIGALIGRNKEKPMWQQILSVFMAAFIANYTAPVAVELFGLSEKTLPGLGFIIGYSGKTMLDYTIGKIKKKADEKIEE
jgi:hypothetical protein